MPIDFSNVNISLQQFQKISSGKYNAGEIMGQLFKKFEQFERGPDVE